MAIDPDLYEKVSGRKMGEAMNRYGESLAKKTAERKSIESLKEYEANAAWTMSDLMIISWLKRYPVLTLSWVVGVPVVLVLIALIVRWVG
ncbi:MAG: hypothetical protein KF768_07405 [Phycisphaeraceae bacterium]|nr:hypothetical protein [Phycisphaeraceae bacterium]